MFGDDAARRGSDRRRHAARGLAPILAALAVLALTVGARADGGVLQVVQRSGPYEITVYTSPGPLLANLGIDVSALVELYPAGDTVNDAQVTVRAVPVGHGGATQTFQATHAQATNKVFYATNVHLPAGRWQLTVAAHAAAGDGSVGFPLDIGATTRARGFPWGRLAAGLAALLVVGWAVWLVERVRRQASGDRR